MAVFAQFLNFTWGTPGSLGGLEASRLSSSVNESLRSLQERGAKIQEVRPSYLIEHAGVVVMILYEAAEAIEAQE
jgi:hypothetical protein